MPVHFFTPPSRVREAVPALEAFVANLEAAGETVVSTQPYGQLVAIFTTRSTSPSPSRKAATR